jgi:hypothetical protein
VRALVADDLIIALEKLLQQYGARLPSTDVPMAINDFCRVENISVSTFHKWQRLGIGPEVGRIPGMTLQRITPAAYKKWKKQRAARQREQAPVIEQERAQRTAHARAAGQLAAASPKHISKQRKRGKRKA